VAAWIGSALEYYDFFIYGTAAALEFGKVFFPDSSPTASTLLALATFGVGYVARPVGAFILGHVGDRFGRKRVLVFTVLLMGGATFLVGCLPTYGQVGVTAPALLVALRLLQGLSAAGEQAGANSMSLEHAPENRRSYYTSWTLSGTQAGQILATAVFLPVAAMPTAALESSGWRGPFWASALVVVAAFVIRRKLEETPVFEREVAAGDQVKLPIAVVPGPLGRRAARGVRGRDRRGEHDLHRVRAVLRGELGWARAHPDAADRDAGQHRGAGRDPVVGDARRPHRAQAGVARLLPGCAVLIFAYLAAIASGDYVLVFVVGILMFGVVDSATNAVWPAFYGEMFPARVRLSGMAIGTQIGFATGGFTPSIATAVAGEDSANWGGVAIFTASLCLMNAIAVVTGRDNYRVPTAELGRKGGRGTVAMTSTGGATA